MTGKADALVMVRHNMQLSQLATRRLTGTAADTAEEWLTGLGTKFIDEQLFIPKDGRIEHSIEHHVDDCSTLPETVRLSMERCQARYAIYSYMGRWCLITPGKSPTRRIRYYDTREAAEMVAILNG